AVRIGIRARGVRRWTRKGVVAEGTRRVGEHLAGEKGSEGRQRVFARARRFEGVAAGNDLALQISRLAVDRGGVLEPVVVGLELGVADAPVLDRHVLGDALPAVARPVLAAGPELHLAPAPGMAAPAYGRAADFPARLAPAQAQHGSRIR